MDTKPKQLSKHGRGSSPPVGDVVAEIWVWRTVSERRAPGWLLESRRVNSSNWAVRVRLSDAAHILEHSGK